MNPLSDEKDEVRVAIRRGYPAPKFMKIALPKTRGTAYDDNYLALSSAANKQNDYFFGNSLTSSFILSRDFYHSLEMVKFWREPRTGNHFTAPEHQRQLLGILDNFIISHSEQIHKQVA